ncbi:MAG: phosphate ABC transporter permease subunit PstC [Clostridium sp.]|nr:phosphate ABC transporter permease subunit PstC [Clostridium sp.]
MKQLKNTADLIEKAIKFIFTVCGFLVIAFVLMITVFLVINGLPAIKEIGFSDFFLNTKWASTAAPASYGILPFVMSSVYGTLGAVIIGVPIGIMCAVFIAKSAPPKIAKVVSSAVDLLSGIPSVIYGLLGMIIIVPLVRELFDIPDGANMFSAIIVLSVMILPSVISVSQTAIDTVPTEYEEASLALGATKTETVFKVTLPAAKSGIVTAVILGIGRAIGEAMAVMMVAGNVANMPSIFKSVRFLTTAVASEMAYSSGLQRQALFSIALVLFLFIMAINIILNATVKKNKE